MLKRILASRQWLFLPVEAAFSAAFGECVNLLYALGSVWPVLVTMLVRRE